MCFLGENSLNRIFLLILIPASAASHKEIKEEPGLGQEYCQSDSFHPRCQKNEIILMKTATYGRMRIGKCITAEEVEAQRKVVEEVHRYLGCSADVLTVLDQKCSGKPECEIRIADKIISSPGSVRPCLPGLNVHLEASYDCISVVDGQRSCVVVASQNPTHLVAISSQGICGTRAQPWTVEAPVGQRILVSLIDLTIGGHSFEGDMQQCYSQGFIVDRPKTGRNASICVNGAQREKQLHTSSRNAVDIIFLTSEDRQNDHDNSTKFILRVEAIGCSDIIPPEDSWVKRSDDSVVIGCYSNRQAWHLDCKEGKWVGVLGNCSQDFHISDSTDISDSESTTLSTNGQVLATVAIVGFTLAICVAIICTGTVCLHRFYAKSQKRLKRLEYKTLNSTIASAGNHLQFTTDQRMCSSVAAGTDIPSFAVQHVPPYSVFVEDDQLHYSRGGVDDRTSIRVE